MTISYRKLESLMERTGHSFHSLNKQGVLSDFAGRKISSGQPINLEHVESLCKFFNVPIEDIVEIILDEDQSSESE